jgi:hypothetical protein
MPGAAESACGNDETQVAVRRIACGDLAQRLPDLFDGDVPQRRMRTAGLSTRWLKLLLRKSAQRIV